MARTKPKNDHPAPHIRNKKAAYKYVILEKIECGLCLLGTEVKSLRDGQVSLDEAFARMRDGELWLIGAHFAPYRFGNTANHDPLRPRKLLVHRSELVKLGAKVAQKGLTIVPLALYFNDRGLAKATLGLAQGKTHADKRQTLRARDDRREMERARNRRR